MDVKRNVKIINIKIKTDREKMQNDFFNVMNPYFNLSEKEIEILAIIYSKDKDEITKETKNFIKESMNITTKQLCNILVSLREKGTLNGNKLIQDYKLDAGFKINIDGICE